MSTTEQEMNEALDALEADAGESLDKEENLNLADEHLENEDVIDDEIIDDEPKDKPPGYLTYEEWTAAGKDPADFRGENAYKKQYDALKEVRDLKETMHHVVDSVDTWKQQQNEQMVEQIAQAKAEAAKELTVAKENDDMDAALEAQDRINQLNQKKVTPVPQVSPVIADFAKKNPIIDQNNTQYDAEFHQDMIMIHNGKLDMLLGGDRTRAGELTPQQIDRVQKLAFNQAKELHADKFVSPRNKRTTTAQPRKRVAQTPDSVKSKLKSVEGNSRNPRDTNAASEIFDIINEKDPEAAKVFAKNLTGEG